MTASLAARAGSRASRGSKSASHHISILLFFCFHLLLSLCLRRTCLLFVSSLSQPLHPFRVCRQLLRFGFTLRKKGCRLRVSTCRLVECGWLLFTLFLINPLDTRSLERRHPTLPPSALPHIPFHHPPASGKCHKSFHGIGWWMCLPIGRGTIRILRERPYGTSQGRGDR